MDIVFYGNGIVWDPENQRKLCEFSKAEEPNGKGELRLQSSDKKNQRIIRKLKDMGFECVDPRPIEEQESAPPKETIIEDVITEDNVIEVKPKKKPRRERKNVREID